jgi:hypothetical protein
MLSMPFNSTSIKGLYCVGDSTFPGQVSVPSGICCGLAGKGGGGLACSQGRTCTQSRPSGPPSSCHMHQVLSVCCLLQGVNAVVFSGFGCAHR